MGRFVSVDPLQHKYPYYTPYQYAGNKPVTYIDLDGLEPAEGDKNYGKNIILSDDRVVRGIHPSMRDSTNTNWIVKHPKTVEEAKEIVEEFKPIFLAFQSHGVRRGDNYGINLFGKEGFDLPRSIDGNDIQSSDIQFFLAVEKYGKDQIKTDFDKEKWLANEGKAISELKQLFDAMPDDSSIIMLNCNLGLDEEMMESLYQLSGERLNFYAFTGIVQPEYLGGDSGTDDNGLRIEEDKSVMTYLDSNIVFKNGIWKMIGKVTEGKVQSIDQVDKGSNGQLKLNKSGEPISYE